MRKNCDNGKYDAWDYVGAKPCDKCYTGKDAPTLWEAGGNYVPPTNADRIRAMTDEELAQWHTPKGCPTDRPGRCHERSCKDCWIEWLQQPAEGD